jgi:putative salt-induced outer membrane protein
MRIATIVLAAAAALAAAEDGGTWEGTVSLGGLLTSGNSRVAQLDAGADLARPVAGPDLTADLKASASYGSQDDETYRETYATEAGLRWDFTGHSYSRLRGYWNRDELSGVSHEYGATAGLGRRLLDGPVLSASLEAGAGLLSRESTADSVLKTSTGYIGTDMEWLLTESWTVTGEARLNNDFQNSKNYSLESTLEASSSITGSLSFLVGFDVDYRNLPAVEGGERTDTALRLQLRLGI